MIAEPAEIVIEQTYTPQSDPEALWLVERVDDWLELGQKPRDSKGWFHASSLGRSDDDLIAMYRGKYIDHGHDATQLRVFDLGHDRDRSWKRYMAKAGLSTVKGKTARRIKLPHMRIVGECDDIVRDPDGTLWVVEVKTINPYLWSQLKRPKPEHVLQVHVYMAALAIHRSIVLYECKSTQRVLAFVVPFDPEAWTGIVRRLRDLRLEAERAG